jgi:hypothetical protein
MLIQMLPRQACVNTRISSRSPPRAFRQFTTLDQECPIAGRRHKAYVRAYLEAIQQDRYFLPSVIQPLALALVVPMSLDGAQYAFD